MARQPHRSIGVLRHEFIVDESPRPNPTALWPLMSAGSVEPCPQKCPTDELAVPSAFWETEPLDLSYRAPVWSNIPEETLAPPNNQAGYGLTSGGLADYLVPGIESGQPLPSRVGLFFDSESNMPGQVATTPRSQLPALSLLNPGVGVIPGPLHLGDNPHKQVSKKRKRSSRRDTIRRLQPPSLQTPDDIVATVPNHSEPLPTSSELNEVLSAEEPQGQGLLDGVANERSPASRHTTTDCSKLWYKCIPSVFGDCNNCRIRSKKHVSELKPHHERLGFHACHKCMVSYPDAEPDHECREVCPQEGCPNYAKRIYGENTRCKHTRSKGQVIYGSLKILYQARQLQRVHKVKLSLEESLKILGRVPGQTSSFGRQTASIPQSSPGSYSGYGSGSQFTPTHASPPELHQSWNQTENAHIHNGVDQSQHQASSLLFFAQRQQEHMPIPRHQLENSPSPLPTSSDHSSASLLHDNWSGRPPSFPGEARRPSVQRRPLHFPEQGDEPRPSNQARPPHHLEPSRPALGFGSLPSSHMWGQAPH